MTSSLDQVTIVMVTYNSRHVIEHSLTPLAAMRNVIVVDNASQDGTAEAATQVLPGATVIRNAVNVGFGRANNIALECVTTPFALLLNPDCVMGIESIQALLAAAARYPEAAILAPKIYLAPGKLGQSFRPFFFRKQPDYFIEPEGDVCAEWLIGAAMLFNMQHMRSVGFFDPWFFLFYEEEDLCLRVRHAGHSLVLVSEAHAQHAGRRSSRPSARLTFRLTYCMTLSKLYITGKYLGRLRLAGKWCSVLVGSVLGLPFFLLTFNRRLVMRNLARLWAALRAPSELNARHCLVHQAVGREG